ncbi:hypothetical protein PTKIN_Ptkin17bG0135800 [Pterospermum kingtungense]
MYYHITLEQRWEHTFACDNNGHNKDNVAVVLDVTVEREVVRLGGIDQVSKNERDGVMWFRIGEVGVGLSMAIVERMKREQERFGWSGGVKGLKE